VLLEVVDAELTVSLLQSGQRQVLQRLPAGATPDTVDAALPPRVAGLPRFGLLPASAVLRKPLRMPAAAEARLREVLGFEIDRQTPFNAIQVHYDVRLLQRRGDGQLDTELVVAPRPLVDALLGPGEAWQQQLDGVDAVDAEGMPLGVNLLPMTMRRQRHDPMRRLNRLLLIAGLVMLVLGAWQLLENRRAAAARLSAQVDATAVRARAVAAQRQQLQDLVDGQQFFTAQRAQQASATEIINELSQRLGDDTSLEKLSIEGGRMQLIGMSSSASSLVSKLEGSRLWKTPSLTGVLQAGQGAGRERFTLTAELRGPNTEAADGTAPRAP
ncbi:MAG: PilN domain-containing protein, partial [Stenotrophomonas sp.]